MQPKRHKWDDDVLFSQEEMDRYARTVALKEVGYEGQTRLKKSRVLVVGAGGLGSPALLYLAAAGVGCIGICDMDEVDVSNLQRQVIHDTEGAEKKEKKVASAMRAVKRLNPNIEVVPIDRKMTPKLAEEVVPHYDLVMDCLDNHKTRYLLSDMCVKYKKPLVTAAVDRYLGTVRVMCTKNAPCMRCMAPRIPPPGDEPRCVGLFGTGTGVLGVLQAAEALKIIMKLGKTLEGRTIYYDGLNATMNMIGPILRNPGCKWCGKAKDAQAKHKKR